MALVVVTGGSRSGKSRVAQSLAEEAARLPHVGGDAKVVVGVFGRTSTDEEMERRVSAHRDSRPGHFETLEFETLATFPADIAAADVLLIDCLGTALGLCMEECWPAGDGSGLAMADPDTLPDGYAEAVAELFAAVVDAILDRSGDTVVVTNEVGSGLVSTWASGRLFADLLGGTNRRLVAESDAAYLAVCGTMIDLKAFDARPSWPAD